METSSKQLTVIYWQRSPRYYWQVQERLMLTCFRLLHGKRCWVPLKDNNERYFVLNEPTANISIWGCSLIGWFWSSAGLVGFVGGRSDQIRYRENTKPSLPADANKALCSSPMLEQSHGDVPRAAINSPRQTFFSRNHCARKRIKPSPTSSISDLKRKFLPIPLNARIRVHRCCCRGVICNRKIYCRQQHCYRNHKNNTLS